MQFYEDLWQIRALLVMNEYVSYAPLTNSSICFDLETQIGAVYKRECLLTSDFTRLLLACVTFSSVLR